MTIVASEDTRNSEWTKSNKGHSLLSKMGWTEGQGLGKRKQGTAHALRAVRRLDDSLGIGAQSSDTTGSQGWDQNVGNFASVLSNLQSHHSGGGSSSDEEKKRKKSKKSKKSKSKHKNKDNHNKELVLARNKVNAGHARKMRDAKDLTNKSDYDLAAIFGTKPPPPTASSSSSSNSSRRTTQKRQRTEEENDPKEESLTRKEKKKKSKKEKKKSKVSE